MAPHEAIKQIGLVSKKVFFQYNLKSNEFDYLSEGAKAIFKKYEQEIRQTPDSLNKYIHDDDKVAVEEGFHSLLKGTPVTTNFRIKLPEDEVETNIGLEAHPIHDDGGGIMAFAGVAEDVTKQVQYENYLIRFSKKKDSMLEILLHDLQGPIAIVQSVANALVADHKIKLYDETNTYARFINDACNHCIDLINSLLDEEHTVSPNIVVKRKRIDLVKEIKSIIAAYIAGDIKREFKLNSAQDVIMAEVDSLKITQVINNLISNSIKFTEEQKGKISIDISQNENNILIKHSDNGIGIPKDLQPYLFEKYSKASRAGLRGEKSRGIGLSIVRDLVEVHGGKIWFETQEGVGTTFFISLPL